MESEVLIEARGLSRRYGPATAVSALDLTLRKGEVLGLLGPNGAGKSTTMKMLTGNLAPSEGEVFIRGVNLADDPRAAKRHLGYLPEQPPVYPELTVREYLDFCAGLHGVARSDRAEALASAMRDCGLLQVANRLIGNLSKGYQQRVGLAQAIIHRPDVVILDEPTVGLDPAQIREIRNLIKELGQQHSVILSSHILPEIQSVCSRVVIIQKGTLVYDAAVDAHLGSAAVVVEFAQAVAEDALAALPGVVAVSSVGDARYRLEPAADTEIRDTITAACVQHGWLLRSMGLEQATLEDVFMRLTSGAVETNAVNLEKAA